jgi:uncharacterized coiled-coil protein SlyX
MQLDDLTKSVDSTKLALDSQTAYVQHLKDVVAADSTKTNLQVFCEQSWTLVPAADFIALQQASLDSTKAKYDKLVKLRDDLQAALDEATASSQPTPPPPAS